MVTRRSHDGRAGATTIPKRRRAAQGHGADGVWSRVPRLHLAWSHPQEGFTSSSQDTLKSEAAGARMYEMYSEEGGEGLNL